MSFSVYALSVIYTYSFNLWKIISFCLQAINKAATPKSWKLQRSIFFSDKYESIIYIVMYNVSGLKPNFKWTSINQSI